LFAVNPQQGQPEEQRKGETNEDIAKLGCGLLQQVRGLRAVQLILTWIGRGIGQVKLILVKAHHY
jgi:hypothetical protein